MSSSEMLIEAFGRIQATVRSAVDGLTTDQLAFRPGTGTGNSGNSVAWLIWHLSRVQDNHIAEAAGQQELWLSDGWADRFNLDLDQQDTGYGHSTEQVGKVRVDSPELLTEYYEAVHARTLDFIRGLGETDFDRIVDSSWDPPVTLQVRLVSVLDDCTQHVGQASYVRGLLKD